MKTFHIYSDESRHKNERFLLLGGLWIEENQIEAAENEVKVLRRRHGFVNSEGKNIDFLGELKWTKVSSRYLYVYKDVVDLMFMWIEKGIIRFNIMLIDTHDPGVGKYSNIGKEGYFKFLYQLYFHNSKIPAVYQIYPDRITNPLQSNVNFNVLKQCLNSALGKKFSPLLNPAELSGNCEFVNNITPLDSKSSQFIQIVDVVMGAIGYLQNELDGRENARKAKIELMKYIFEKLVLSRAIQISGKKYFVARSTKFNIWLFRPNKKSP